MILLFKYVTGSVTAVLCATALNLNYAYSAGIITLLTIQETRRETLRLAAKRVAVFFIMTGLSAFIFPLFGYHVWAFGIALVPYLFFCMLLDMKEAITSVAVLCTHYIAAATFSASVILNELMLLLVGAGVGIAVNYFMPDSLKRLGVYRSQVDDKITDILRKMSEALSDKGRMGYMDDLFEELEVLLLNLKKEALIYINNHFWRADEYYYSYMQMRARQCTILRQIACDIGRLTILPEQVKMLAEFVGRVADEYEEKNDACRLLNELEELRHKYSLQSLPISRAEFENRAILYHILEDIRIFLEIKGVFAGALCRVE